MNYSVYSLSDLSNRLYERFFEIIPIGGLASPEIFLIVMKKAFDISK